jgi:hypothetical protein
MLIARQGHSLSGWCNPESIPATVTLAWMPMSMANANPCGCSSKGAQASVFETPWENAPDALPDDARAALGALHIGATKRVESVDIGHHEVDMSRDEMAEQRWVPVEDGQTREGGCHHRS